MDGAQDGGLARSESLALVKSPKPKPPESKTAAASLMRAPCSAAASSSILPACLPVGLELPPGFCVLARERGERETAGGISAARSLEENYSEETQLAPTESFLE